MHRIIIVLLLFLSCKSNTGSNSVVYSDKEIKEAVPFAPGIISTPENSEFDIMFSPDGKTAYFSRRAPEEKQKIHSTTFENGKWSTPIVESFSTDRDEAPFITPDGKYFFFGSERPIPGKPNKGNFDMNIWVMDKTTNGWNEPKPLSENINSVQEEGEQWPSSNNSFIYSIDNKNFYFTAMRRGRNAIELYQTQFDGVDFTAPKKVPGIFSDEKYWIYAAVISPDGQYLVFNSYGAPGGKGGEDIFISKRTENGWTEAKGIGEKINSKNEESKPMFSRDGKYFFFNRSEHLENDKYGEWGVFFIETKYLELEKLFN